MKTIRPFAIIGIFALATPLLLGWHYSQQGPSGTGFAATGQTDGMSATVHAEYSNAQAMSITWIWQVHNTLSNWSYDTDTELNVTYCYAEAYGATASFDDYIQAGVEHTGVGYAGASATDP